MSGETASAVEFRPTEAYDVPSEYAVFVAAQRELHERRGAPADYPPFNPSGMVARTQKHLLDHDGERAFVADAEGRIIGFTAALLRGDWWYFSTLFIDPAFQGRGVGRRLLDLGWDAAHPRRSTITEAIQPVSTGLYARRGLLPVTPVLDFVGRPTSEHGPGELESATPTPDALRAIDLAATALTEVSIMTPGGGPRRERRCGCATPCAYSYRGGFLDGRATGPVAGADPASAALALRAELAANPGQEIRIEIPGSATALAEVALEAGLRLSDPDLLLLSPPEQPPTAYAIHSSWLL